MIVVSIASFICLFPGLPAGLEYVQKVNFMTYF